MTESIAPKIEQPKLVVADMEAWRVWLEENADSSDGVWLILAKKGTVNPTSLNYKEALEEALCFGWIDGQRRSFDEDVFIQRFTPRRKASMWSQRNVGFIEELTKAGRMNKRGHEEVAKAKADGRWARAYAGSASMKAPAELTLALEASPEAKAVFENLTSQERYVAMLQITTAASSEVRDAKLKRLIAKWTAVKSN